MRLTPPSFVIFLISFIIVLGVVLARYSSIDVPLVAEIARKSALEVTLLAYVLLFVGVVFRKL